MYCLQVKADTLEILEMFSIFYSIESTDLTNKRLECRLLMFSEIFKRGDDVFELDESTVKTFIYRVVKK